MPAPVPYPDQPPLTRKLKSFVFAKSPRVLAAIIRSLSLLVIYFFRALTQLFHDATGR